MSSRRQQGLGPQPQWLAVLGPLASLPPFGAGPMSIVKGAAGRVYPKHASIRLPGPLFGRHLR